MLKFVQHRVADPRILRLIQKWLKAGVVEEGKWSETKRGTPQGSVISPLLANIFLHYVFDLWVDVWRKKCAQGDVIVVRYADDIVLGFQHQAEADRFLKDFRERLGKFGLELHPEKTRRIEFGRFAEQNRERRGEGKPMSARTDLCGGYQATGIPTATRDQPLENNDFGPPEVTSLAEIESIMLPKGQNWILMLALFLAVSAFRSPSSVPRNQSRDDHETLGRFPVRIRVPKGYPSTQSTTATAPANPAGA